MIYHKPNFSYKFFLTLVLVLHSDSQANSGSSPKIKTNHLKPQVMKKTALTIGLFSMVAVATSFASTEVPTYLAVNDSIKILPPIDGGGQQGKNNKKLDVYSSSNELNSNKDKLQSFASDSQLTKSRIKLD